MAEQVLSPTEQQMGAAYDALYAARASTPLVAGLYALAMGEGYPHEVNPSSSCDWPLLATLVRELRLRPGQQLVDLGCGTGGAGLWLSRALAANLIGIDVSPIAVRLAGARADHFVPRGQAAFRVGTFASTGLTDASADGVMCVESLAFAPDTKAAMDEIRRILRPRARAVVTFTGWGPLRGRWRYEGVELEAEEDRPGVARMYERLYALWVEHEAELRKHLGEEQAQSMLAEARRRAPDMHERHFSVVTFRRMD